MTWTRFAALGLAVALQAASGIASAAPARRETVRAVLRGHEQSRMIAEDWRRLGEDVDLQLIDAASDATLVFGARQRALSALGVVGGPRAKEFLHRVLTREGSGPLLASAVHAYARGFGAEDPVEAQKQGTALLGHADWQVRRGAVRALALLEGEAARSALRARESRERHPAVRTALKAALAERRSR